MTGHRLTGFTLVEMMAGVVIFATILGTLFSVSGALRQTQRFRDDNVAVTQASSFAFQPIIDAIKNASAFESIPVIASSGRTCLVVRGYYGVDAQGQPIMALDTQNAITDRPVTPAGIAAIDAEQIQGATVGSYFRWVKHVYTKEDTGLIERTYYNTSWPKPLDSCHDTLTWSSDPIVKHLTSDKVRVTALSLRLIAPILDPASVNQTKNSPFATVSLTIDNPKAKVALPMTQQTTVTPTFTYGDQANVSL